MEQREIKFRCWDGKRFNEWGYLDPYKVGIVFVSPPNPKYPTQQFTGLKDCKGNDIYEGDIVYYSGLNCIVEWDKNDCKFILKREGVQKQIGQNAPLKKNNIQQMEVKGNIYENARL